MNEIPSAMVRSSHSRASDTSSAYSGSDVMQSSTNGEDCLMINNSENCLGQNDDGGLSRCISIHETDDESETSSEVRKKEEFSIINFFLLYLFFFSVAFIPSS